MQATNGLTTQGHNVIYSQSSVSCILIEYKDCSLMILCQPRGSGPSQTGLPGSLKCPYLKPIGLIPSPTSSVLQLAVLFSPLLLVDILAFQTLTSVRRPP